MLRFIVKEFPVLNTLLLFVELVFDGFMIVIHRLTFFVCLRLFEIVYGGYNNHFLFFSFFYMIRSTCIISSSSSSSIRSSMLSGS